MRSLRSLLVRLHAEVLVPANVPRFEAARRRHTAIASYSTIGAALDVLADEGKGSYPEKEALTRAFLAEFQTSHNSFWATVLLSAYAPLLRRLRGRITGDVVPRDELDQLVLASFLEVAAVYPLELALDRTALRLRQATARAVFAQLQRVQAEQKRMRLLCGNSLVESEGLQTHRRRAARVYQDPDEIGEAIAWLVIHTSALLDGEGIALVATTVICRRRLQAYLDHAQPNITTVEQERAYQRIKRRHSRLLARLRSTLAQIYNPDEVPLRRPHAQHSFRGTSSMLSPEHRATSAHAFRQMTLALCGVFQAHDATPEWASPDSVDTGVRLHLVG